MLKETTNKSFSINQIDDETVQIFGLIKGVAHKRPWPGEVAGSYCFNIKFFDSKGRLIMISNDEKDGTIRSAESLKERLTKIYEREFNSN